MAARYVAVVHPGRPPYTLRHPKNLRRMVREQISAEVATSTFRARQPEIVEYAPPPFPTPAKWPGGVVLEVLRRRKSVRADVTTCAEGPPS